MTNYMPKKVAQTPGNLIEVPLDKLVVVPGYQREYRQERVDKIVAEFDPSKVQPPRIVPIEEGTFGGLYNGLYHTSDGQHTVGSLRVLGYTHAMAFEMDGTLKEAAEDFLAINHSGYRKAASALDRFEVGVQGAENAESREIQALAAKYGFTIGPRSNNSVAANTIGAVIKMESAYRKGVLEKVLQVMSLWPYDDKRTLSEFIASLSQFLSINGVDFDRFVKRVAEPRVKGKPSPTPTSIWAEANAASISQNGTIKEYVKILKEIYNKGLQEGKGRIK